MTNKEICREAIALNLVETSTEFWKGVYISGLGPLAYLLRLMRIEEVGAVAALAAEVEAERLQKIMDEEEDDRLEQNL